MNHFQRVFYKIATDFAFLSILLYPKTENAGNIQVLSLAEVWSEYHEHTTNVFKTQENDHLCYSAENILFSIKVSVFLRCQLVKDLNRLSRKLRVLLVLFAILLFLFPFFLTFVEQQYLHFKTTERFSRFRFDIITVQ